MATKTIAIPEDVHQIISEVQLDIRKKHGINLKLSYIVTSVLKKYARNMEDILKEGFRNTGEDKAVGVKSAEENQSQELVLEDIRA